MASLAEYPETPDLVLDHEVLLRQLIYKKWIKIFEQAVILTPEAVEPLMRKTADGSQKEVHGFSVTRKLSLTLPQIYRLGADVVQIRNTKEPNRFSYLGYASFEAKDLRKLGLDILKSEPPTHHADVVGWPSPVPLRTSEQLEVNNLKLALVRLAVVHLA